MGLSLVYLTPRVRQRFDPEESATLVRGEDQFMMDTSFHPDSSWVATTSSDVGVTIYPIDRPYLQELKGHTGDIRGLTFINASLHSPTLSLSMPQSQHWTTLYERR